MISKNPNVVSAAVHTMRDFSLVASIQIWSTLAAALALFLLM